MSHDSAWRDSCASTRHDKQSRWLWRLVRRKRLANRQKRFDQILLSGFRFTRRLRHFPECVSRFTRGKNVFLCALAIHAQASPLHFCRAAWPNAKPLAHAKLDSRENIRRLHFSNASLRENVPNFREDFPLRYFPNDASHAGRNSA